MDMVYIGLTVAFFILTAGLVRLIASLEGNNP